MEKQEFKDNLKEELSLININVHESTKCFVIISLGSVIAVKLIFSFHSSKSFIYV